MNCIDVDTRRKEPAARSGIREEEERKGPQEPQALCLMLQIRKHPLNQLEFNHALVHQEELELGSSSPLIFGESKSSQ